MSTSKHGQRVGPLILVLIALLVSSAPLAAGASPSANRLELTPTPQASGASDSDVRLLRSDADGVTFDLTAPDLTFSAANAGAATTASGAAGGCRSIDMAGYVANAEAGQPAVPVKVLLIGAPANATLSASAAPLATVILDKTAIGGAICPAATHVFEQAAEGQYQEKIAVQADPAVYSKDELYPGANVRLVDMGIMRGQRIVRLEVYPVRYNPVSGKAQVARQLRVTVAFESAAGQVVTGDAGAAAAAPTGFEAAFQGTLLNYEQAKAWRVGAEPAAPNAWTPPTPGYKLAVRQAGIYQLTTTQLAAAGLPIATLDPRTFKLYNQGQETAIRVLGEGDGHFDEGDVVVFYGQGVSTRYTDANVYWLTYGGGQGLRMSTKASQAGGATASAFRSFVRLEDNLAYVSSLPKEPGYDHWYGKLWTATGTSKSFTENLTPRDLATAASGTGGLQVRLAGNVDRRHHLRLYVNNQQVLDEAAAWTGRTVYTATASFPHSVLVAGANQVKVELVNDVPGFVVDQVYADWMRLDYQRNYTAEADGLAFGGDAAGNWQYRITGFSSAAVETYDITDPASPSLVTGGSVTGSGPYTLEFGDANVRRYMALAIGARLAPVSITADAPSNLQSGPGADTIIITHAAFRNAIQPLADLRSSQGQRVRVVNVDDVYDEFGYGLMSAEAIRDFIAYAYASPNWTRPAPANILLVGDGTYDMRGYLSTSSPTYIPPFLAMVDPDLGETATDNRFVAVQGSAANADDILPDLNIGRLPANSVAETTAMVNKVLAYETVTPDQAWTSRVLLVSDDIEDGGGNFYALSDAIASGYSLYKGRQVRNLPQPYEATKIYLGQTCDKVGNPAASVECRQQVIEALNTQGALFVSYIGHGTKTYWAKEHMYDAQSVVQLQTGNHLPVMLPMTCNEGFFQEAAVGSESLSEASLRSANTGSAASWSATGFGLSSGHDYLERGLLVNMFYGRIAELGAATTAAKLYLVANAGPGAYEDLIETFLLLGDPGLRVPLQDVAGNTVYLPTMMKAAQ